MCHFQENSGTASLIFNLDHKKKTRTKINITEFVPLKIS